MADEPLPLLPHEERLPPRTDLWIAASFFVLGAAILVLGWRMPTYADQGGQIYTAPGLVPGFYGRGDRAVEHLARRRGHCAPARSRRARPITRDRTAATAMRASRSRPGSACCSSSG